MKVLLFTLILLSQLFSNEVEEFYTDTKKMISFLEEDNYRYDEQDMYKISSTVGYYKGMLDFYNIYGIYNKFQKLKNTELYDDKLDKKFCLNNVTHLQLGKTLVYFLDKNPTFYSKDKAFVLWGMLSFYECKRE